MRRTTIPVLLILCAGAAGLRADFRYEQTTEITGGTMQRAMRMAGVFSKKARQPIRSRVVVKGDRMAQIQDDVISITDLKAQTITTVYPKKKQYSVVTFDEMRQFLDQMSAKAAADKPAAERPQVKVSVHDTGNTRNINGRQAREIDFNMQIQGRNPQTGQTGVMNMLVKSWIAPVEPGYQEVRDFYQRLAQKLHWAPSAGLGPLLGGQGPVEGLSRVWEEAAKLDGMPVLQVIRTGYGDLSAEPAAGQQQKPKSVTGSIAKGLGGLGGFGGFGRRKKKKEPEPEPAAGPGGGGPLMEMTITFSGFSSAPVDPSLVDTQPAGFKQVRSEMEKALQ